jgi:hypothetical protein
LLSEEVAYLCEDFDCVFSILVRHKLVPTSNKYWLGKPSHQADNDGQTGNSFLVPLPISRKCVQDNRSGQLENALTSQAGRVGYQAVIPNPKLRLLGQVREVMRLKHC